ncbi:MAG: cation:proton antiporter, partial [Pirellulaceae bacterium]
MGRRDHPHETVGTGMDERLFQYLAAVPVLGVIAQWLAWRVKLPSILVLLVFGIVLGRIVNIDHLLVAGTPEDSAGASRLLFPFVSLSVAVILFEGGLSLRFRELKEAGSGVVRLVMFGSIVSWALTSVLAWWILEFDYRLAVLLGAILVVTGPTVVQPLLRHIRPTRRVAAILKWEGIVIDPIGAMLAVLVFE